MKTYLHEYDQRQYRLMLEQIEAFESERIALEHLVAGLESLSAALEEKDSSWKVPFGRLWGILDNAYANLVTKGLSSLSPDEQRLVNDAVCHLKSLVESKLDEPL